jgi:hypothetical protein
VSAALSTNKRKEIAEKTPRNEKLQENYIQNNCNIRSRQPNLTPIKASHHDGPPHLRVEFLRSNASFQSQQILKASKEHVASVQGCRL